MMKDYANDWRSKLTDVSKLFDKEEEAKIGYRSMMKSYKVR